MTMEEKCPMCGKTHEMQSTQLGVQNGVVIIYTFANEHKEESVATNEVA